MGLSVVSIVFLSCLFGSEHKDFFDLFESHFLSCLFGSERDDRDHDGDLPFLSCLFGSEHSGSDELRGWGVSELPIRQ